MVNGWDKTPSDYGGGPFSWLDDVVRPLIIVVVMAAGIGLLAWHPWASDAR